MSIFKPIKRAMDLRVGKKYIDVKHRRVVVIDEVYVSRGCVECHDVDDEGEILWLTFREVHDCLREFNLSTLELRVLLTASMIEFIELMLSENYKGGEDKDEKGNRNLR